MRPDDPRHGSDNGYSNGRCRCDLCTAAHARYQAGLRHRAQERLAAMPRPRTCPFCGRPNDLAGGVRPFCSIDCRDATAIWHDHQEAS